MIQRCYYNKNNKVYEHFSNLNKKVIIFIVYIKAINSKKTNLPNTKILSSFERLYLFPNLNNSINSERR